MSRLLIALSVLAVTGCTDAEDSLDRSRVVRVADAVVVPPTGQDTVAGVDIEAADSARADTSEADSSTTPDTTGASDTSGARDTGPPCPLGHACNPIPITAFPFSDSRTTTGGASRDIDAYRCAPDTDESGPELFYRFTVSDLGALRVTLDDVSGDDVDIDIHLMTGPDGATCLGRDNRSLMWVLQPGTYWLAADTWVNGSGDEKDGAYRLDATFTPLDAGDCALEIRDQPMFWSACDANLDCYRGDVDGTERSILRTPAAGPVVREAHLVTTDEDFPSDNGWPTSARDQIERHYTLSQDLTGFEADRTDDWAPFGEGGSQWGQAAYFSKVPADAEAWYVNMYWRPRPTPGTRLLVFNPENGRAVVAAGGYETGPGSNTAIGGAVEEIHHYLGTDHRDDLVMGYLIDQSLGYGPIDCGL